MSRIRLRWLVPFMVLAALVSFSVVAQASDAVETRIALRGSAAYPNVTGKATYKVDGVDRKLEVEVQHATTLVGRRLIVLVNGTRFGTMTVNSFGHAEIEHETERGQAVPRIVSGSTVRVKTAAGVIVATGRFP